MVNILQIFGNIHNENKHIALKLHREGIFLLQKGSFTSCATKPHEKSKMKYKNRQYKSIIPQRQFKLDIPLIFLDI